MLPPPTTRAAPARAQSRLAGIFAKAAAGGGGGAADLEYFLAEAGAAAGLAHRPEEGAKVGGAAAGGGAQRAWEGGAWPRASGRRQAAPPRRRAPRAQGVLAALLREVLAYRTLGAVGGGGGGVNGHAGGHPAGADVLINGSPRVPQLMSAGRGSSSGSRGGLHSAGSDVGGAF